MPAGQASRHSFGITALLMIFLPVHLLQIFVLSEQSKQPEICAHSHFPYTNLKLVWHLEQIPLD